MGRGQSATKNLPEQVKKRAGCWGERMCGENAGKKTYGVTSNGKRKSVMGSYRRY